MEHTTGLDLKVERVRAKLSLNEVVAEMGVSRTTVWTIEKAPEVKPETAQAYRDAIARLSEKAAA